MPDPGHSTPNLSSPRRRRVANWALAALLCAVALLSLWLRSGFPVHAIPTAGNDDALFVRLARSLLGRHWLGPFDDRTLVKGMFYPLFIAAAFFAGIPLKIAEQLTYIGAAALIAAVIRRHAPGRDWFAGLVFGALVLNPMLWTDDLARVIREGVYLSLTLAIIGFSILASFDTDGRAPPRTGAVGRASLFGLLAGLTGGCFWLTREEGVWLVPPVVCIAMIATIDAWLRSRAEGRTEPAVAVLRRLILPWGAALAATLVLVGAVAMTNRVRYGAFETTEVQSLAFRRGYGALARIKPEHWQRYVVFPHDARLKAYRVSPAARELEPAFEGPLGADWARTGCEQTGQRNCPEILAGWFQWALRDAVTAAGHYQTAATAAAYYTRLANQIDAACDRHALACLPARATLAPPFRLTYVADALHDVPLVAAILLHPGSEGIQVLPSEGPPDMIAQFADFVGPVMPPPLGARTIRGWVSGAAALPTLVQRSHAGAPTPGQADLAAAPDVDRAYPGGHAVRFSLQTACDDCDLAVTLPGAPAALIPVGRLVTGAFIERPDFKLTIDQNALANPPLSAARRAFITRAAAAIASLYRVALPCFCVLGCLGMLAGLVRRTRPPAALLALAIACAAGVAVRILLLSYLDVTAIPSVLGRYASPAEPLLILFALVGCWIGLPQSAGHVWRRRPARTGRPAPHQA